MTPSKIFEYCPVPEELTQAERMLHEHRQKRLDYVHELAQDAGILNLADLKLSLPRVRLSADEAVGIFTIFNWPLSACWSEIQEYAEEYVEQHYLDDSFAAIAALDDMEITEQARVLAKLEEYALLDTRLRRAARKHDVDAAFAIWDALTDYEQRSRFEPDALQDALAMAVHALAHYPISPKTFTWLLEHMTAEARATLFDVIRPTSTALAAYLAVCPPKFRPELVGRIPQLLMRGQQMRTQKTAKSVAADPDVAVCSAQVVEPGAQARIR